MPDVRLELTTQRLIIKELDSGLAQCVHAASLDADNRRFMPDEVFGSADEAAEAIGRLTAFYGTGDGPLVYAVSLRDGTYIGHVEAVPLGEGGWEIGYHIARQHCGNGYATEAVAAFVPRVLAYLRIDTIHGICDAQNLASCRVLEKCGFSLVSEGAAAYHGRQANVRRYVFSASSRNKLLADRQRLITENERLRSLLHSHGIQDVPPETMTIQSDSDILQQFDMRLPSQAETIPISKQSQFSDKAALFLSYFRGRPEVYARQWQSKDGKIGYSPACKNEWKAGLCRKPKGKCADCENSAYLPYNESAVEAHLSGTCVLGIYPLLSDDTCAFLAIDFDGANWRMDVQAAMSFCDRNHIPYAAEISRSGNGAHLWLFFEEPVDASFARRFGSHILSMAMQEHSQLSFSSYDRMFPNQDTLPKGGFGNLIALPFQKEAYRRGGSVFVDKQFNPFNDQWTYLSSVHKMKKGEMDARIAAWPAPPLGELWTDEEEPDSKPWHHTKPHLSSADFPSVAGCTIADMLYISVSGFSQRALNQIRRFAAFRNPQFYQAQAMHMPVWNKPRVICCAQFDQGYLCLPRGCMDDFTSFAQEYGINLAWQDERNPGAKVSVNFSGKLRDEQQAALDALSAYDNGVLSATTAFGKTVIGAALIGQKKVNTLILVHRKQLMEQWKDRLSEFLVILDELPVEPKKRGRQKQRGIIGSFGAGKDTRSEIVDIAMMQSMGSADDIVPWIANYGMVIVDECHHVPAASFEQVMKKIPAKFIYGLTATPTRQDGHHPILYMHLGNIRYRVDAKEQAAKRPFQHMMIPRFTGARFLLDQSSSMPPIGQYYAQIALDDLRNHQITDDVLACVKEGRSCLILTERTKHVEILAALLGEQVDGVLTLTGGKTSVEAARQLLSLKAVPLDKPLVICATGKYIGEGFDEARLDTLFLAMPISWHGTLAQYAGRLHRLFEGKKEVRVYDYVDNDAEMLEKMYHRRLKGYASQGYMVWADRQTAVADSDVIYDQDSFQERFLSDLRHAKHSIVIVSPYVQVRRVRWLEDTLKHAAGKSVEVSIYTRPADSFAGKASQAARAACDMLKNLGAAVHFRESIHQKHAVIDESIVWYGSINLLSFGASQESMMRLCSGSISRALSMKQKTSD